MYQHNTRFSFPRCLSFLFVTLLFFLPESPANAYDVVLAWDNNSEEKVAGYVLYVDDGFSEILYEYVDTYPLEDINPENPSVRITDLRDGLAYYFVVTAYDIDWNESDYSDEICVIDGEACPDSWLAYRDPPSNPASVSSDSGDSVSSGGGGGSGCFISTSNYSKKNKGEFSYRQILLLLICITLIGIIGLQIKRIITIWFNMLTIFRTYNLILDNNA